MNVIYQTALDRIQEATDTGATELFLSGIELAELPPEIGQLTNLQQLWLFDNDLSSLPAEIGLLTNLRELWLYNNPLKSPPPEIVARGTAAILGYLRTKIR